MLRRGLLEESNSIKARGGEGLREDFLVGNVDVLFPAGAVYWIVSVHVVFVIDEQYVREVERGRERNKRTDDRNTGRIYNCASKQCW
jgi:hypothetical protein